MLALEQLISGWNATRRSADAREEGESELRALCAGLREQLGAFGYQWLCACAVFPVLRLPLTAHLGNELASLAGRPAPHESELLAISALPWFRRGWIPQEMRIELLRDLRPDFAQRSRKAIERFLYYALTGVQVGDSSVVMSLPAPPRHWASMARTWLQLGEEQRWIGESIFPRFMKGKDPARGPRRSRGGSSGRSTVRLILRPRLPLVPALAVCTGAAIFIVSGRLPMERTEQVTVVGAAPPRPYTPAENATRLTLRPDVNSLTLSGDAKFQLIVAGASPQLQASVVQPVQPDEQGGKSVRRPQAAVQVVSRRQGEAVLRVWIVSPGAVAGTARLEIADPQTGASRVVSINMVGQPPPTPAPAPPVLSRTEIAQLQIALGVVADGLVGPATAAAVAAYQRRQGLPPTGQISRELYEALLKAEPRQQLAPPALPQPAPQAFLPVREYQVYFDYGPLDNITPDAQAIISLVVADLKKDPTFKVELIAKADRSLSDSDAQHFTEREAAAVRRALINQGISQDRIQSRAVGSREPPVPTPDGSKEARNRVVEMTVLRPENSQKRAN